jgi:hypothetical protein
MVYELYLSCSDEPVFTSFLTRVPMRTVNLWLTCKAFRAQAHNACDMTTRQNNIALYDAASLLFLLRIGCNTRSCDSA